MTGSGWNPEWQLVAIAAIRRWTVAIDQKAWLVPEPLISREVSGYSGRDKWDNLSALTFGPLRALSWWQGLLLSPHLRFARTASMRELPQQGRNQRRGLRHRCGPKPRLIIPQCR